MRYVLSFPQLNSGCISSLLHRKTRGAAYFLGILLIASALSACMPGGGPGSLSDNPDPSKRPPGTLSYSVNPAYYPYGSTITPNLLSSGGSITSVSISPALPAGLSFNTSNGIISGKPTTVTAAQTYNVRASNPNGTSYLTLTLAVTDQAPTISYGATTSFVRTVGNSLSVSPTLGGGATTSCSSSPPLPAGLILSSQCDISGAPTTPSAATNYTISAINSGGSAQAVLNITVKDNPPDFSYTPPSYTLYRAKVATPITPSNGPSGGAITSCSSDSPLPTGLTLQSDCRITGTPTAITASNTYGITGTNSGGSMNTVVTIGVVEPAPNIIYMPGARTLTVNQPATINVTNSGGIPTTCSPAAFLPSGLSIDVNCNITGTPNTLTSGWSSNVTATNSTGSSSAPLAIDVVDNPPNITYSGTPFTFNVGFAIPTQTPVNTGGAITGCTISPAPPAGLSLSNTCVLSGTPSTAQAAKNYTITATNSGGSRTATISIAVQTLAPSLTYTASPYMFTKGTSIGATINPSNTGSPITSCVSSPTLPAGLSLSNSCDISGTPTSVAGATNYTITGTNAGGSSSGIINITVKDVLPSFSYTGGPFTFTVGTLITTLTPNNTGGAITSCTASPTLPAGLSLSTTCVITGTPTVPVATANYTISGTNSGGTATTSINVTVNDVAPVISYAGSPFNFTTGSAISALTPSNSGGAPVTCAVNPALPSGLNLSNTCVVTGTPTTPSGATNYTITATNTGGSSSAIINISVTSLAPILSYSGSPFTYTKGTTITSVNPINTGGAINGCSSSPSLPTGLSVSSTCVISGKPTVVKAAANYTITATNANGSSSATVNITVNDAPPAIDYIPTSYSFTYTKGTAITPLTPNNSGGSITGCTAAPALPAGLSINATTCTISGTPSGTQASTVYSITASNTGGSSSATITITVNDKAPIISYSGGPFAYTVNAAIPTLNPTTSGGAITSCSSSPGLPGGLNLSSTCVITGTPTVVSAAANYTITATNSGGSASTTVSLQIKDIPPTLSYSGGPFTYTQGITITNANPTNTGGAITGCSSSPTLPAGLSLSNTCVISGAPALTSSATNYTITATNSGGSAAATVSITVNPGPPVLSYSGSPFVFSNGAAISTISPANAGGAITSCSSSPGLPAGLALSPTCVISGTPSAVSSATDYTITGSNSQGSSSYTIKITVNDMAPSIGFTPSSYVQVLRTTISDIFPANSGGAIISCTSNPALPAGLSISSTCVISGTPTVVSPGTDYTITATNSGGSASAIVNIQVKNLPQIVFYSKAPLNGSVNGTPNASNNIWTVTVDGIDKVALTKNTLSGLDSITPVFSSDGTKIAYHSKRATDGSTNGSKTNSFNLWTMLSDSTNSAPLTSNTLAGLDSTSPVSDAASPFPVTAEESPRFSPDGTKIVFASKMPLNGSPNGSPVGSYNIWIANSDGSGLTHLTGNTVSGLDSVQPVFGPSGTVVYFISKTGQDMTDNSVATGTSSYNVWKVNTNGTGRIPLTGFTSSGYDCRDVSVSPDGSMLTYASHAYTTTSSNANFNIWTMGSNGTSPAPTRITSNNTGTRDSRYPRYSPDQAEIVFTSLMRIGGVISSSYNIWKMKSDGTNQVALTKNTASGNDSIYPVYSPDNTMIAFASKLDIGATPSSSYNIWIMKSDGTSQNYLTSNTNTGLDSLLGPGRVWFAP